MSTFDADPVLELEALLDSTRLAAAWQVSRERSPAAGADAAPAPAPAPDAAEEGATDDAASLGPADAPTTPPPAGAPTAASPTALPPLPLAQAHRQLLDELDRTLAASPGLAAKGRLVLAGVLAQLTAVIGADELDAGAAEAALDDLEDLLQALLAAAGWPVRGEE